MTDRELLIFSAKAAGYVRDENWNPHRPGIGTNNWNPLTDDGDALRLAVKLGMNVLCSKTEAIAFFGSDISCHELEFSEDIGAATRRAIVRAAAALGEAMP